MTKRAVKNKQNEDELVLSYLRTGLEMLQFHAEFGKNEEWLSKQNASELGVFHGIIADKCARIYERLGQRLAAGTRSDLAGAAEAGATDASD